MPSPTSPSISPVAVASASSIAGSAERTMRATRGAGLAESTGTYTPPAFSVPMSAAIVQGAFAASTPTRSPGRTPRSTSTRAIRSVVAASSA